MPSPQSRAKLTATPPIMIAAAMGVGAVTTARAARPAAASAAATVSTLTVSLPLRSWRKRALGGVVLALASGARLNAAADSRPKAPALTRGPG